MNNLCIICVLLLLTVTCKAQYIPCVCGEGEKSTIVPIGRYPWYAWIEMLDYKRIYRGCLGTLIHEKFVVFDPKCLGDDNKTTIVRVRFGGNAIISAGEITETGKVIRYQNQNKIIALVKLDREVNCRYQLKPVCIELEKKFTIKNNENITVDGLDSDDYKNRWPVVLAVNTTVVEEAQCLKQLQGKVKPSDLKDKICLKHHDYCMKGVFGGGLTQEYKNKTFIIGMQSRDLCNKGKPTIHTNILVYKEWISEQIKNNKED